MSDDALVGIWADPQIWKGGSEFRPPHGSRTGPLVCSNKVFLRDHFKNVMECGILLVSASFPPVFTGTDWFVTWL